MIINTPALSVREVKVFSALFEAQLTDTLRVIEDAIPEWTAVHVIGAGPAKKGPSPDQMRDRLLQELGSTAMLLDPIYTLTTPEIPAGTLFTLAPDQVRPPGAVVYEGWKYVHYREARARLAAFMDKALGGMPADRITISKALTEGKIKGQPVLEGWTGSVGPPSFKRTMEGLVQPDHKVAFWDTRFGYEAPGSRFSGMSDGILGHLGASHDRLYFDADDRSWFAVFTPEGVLRVAMLD